MAKESNTGGSNHFYYQETPRGRGASCSDNLQSVLMSLVGCQTIWNCCCWKHISNYFQIWFRNCNLQTPTSIFLQFLRVF